MGAVPQNLELHQHAGEGGRRRAGCRVFGDAEIRREHPHPPALPGSLRVGGVEVEAVIGLGRLGRPGGIEGRERPLTAAYRDSLAPALTGLPAPVAEGARSSVAFVSSGAVERFGPAGQQLAAAARQAYVDGVSTAVLTGAAVLITAAIFVFIRAPHADERPAAEQETAAAGR